MSQNVVDFSSDPSGTQLLDNLLTPMKQNILTNNSGTSRPSYAVAHTTWTDTTTTPWVLKYFDGTDDITLGTINATTNVFTISGLTLNKTDATTAPTINDDSGDGYAVGSQWIDVTNDLGYVCLDATGGAAVWKLTTLTTAVVLAGGTYTGKITTVASASGGAGLNVPHGTAPSSPSNGDFWSTTAGFFARVNGVTQQLLSLLGGTLTGKLITLASTTSGAGLNLPHGAAPTSPVDGDVWTTAAGTFAQISGATVSLGQGDVVKISTQTASASANIDFTGLSSTYNKYIIECIDVVPATASSFRARVDTGGGFITTSTYDTYGIGRDSGGNPVTLELVAAAYMDLTAGISLDTTSTIGNNFKIEIVLPSHSKRTRIRFESEFKTDGLSRENHACGGGHNTTTSAVTGFRVYMGSGNITSGTFILYGVK